jgi:hypothetical protein
MVACRGKGDLTCARLNITAVDGHYYLLCFDIISDLLFDHLAPFVTPPPFSIG